MSRDGEEGQPGNDTGQSEQWQQQDNMAFLGMFLLGSGLILIPWKLLWSQPAQWSLAHGAGMYALAVVAALSFRVVARLSQRLLKLSLASLLFAFLLLTPFVGSQDIVYGLVRLTGNRLDGADSAYALLLWVLVGIPLTLYVRRTTPHI